MFTKRYKLTSHHLKQTFKDKDNDNERIFRSNDYFTITQEGVESVWMVGNKTGDEIEENKKAILNPVWYEELLTSVEDFYVYEEV